LTDTLTVVGQDLYTWVGVCFWRTLKPKDISNLNMWVVFTLYSVCRKTTYSQGVTPTSFTCVRHLGRTYVTVCLPSRLDGWRSFLDQQRVEARAVVTSAVFDFSWLPAVSAAAYGGAETARVCNKMNLDRVGVDVLGKISGKEIDGQDEMKMRWVIE